MTLNINKFCKDFRIQPVKSGKHYRNGWVNIDCPFCGGKDGHLGIHIATGAVKCWKCGTHSQIDIIKSLLHCDFGTAKETQNEYLTKRIVSYEDEPRKHREIENRTCTFPAYTGNLTSRHREYLEGRNFDSCHLEKLWGLKGTNHLGDYKFRIIAPITLNGTMVSYQGRDITNKSSLRYKACEQKNEVIQHQNMVYGIDHAKGERCVIVEGITDCWRLGPGAVSCFGTAFTMAQINLLASNYLRSYVLFDADDSNAIRMAREMAVLLSARGLDIELLELEGSEDPGSMPQEEANNLMKELGLKEK